VISVERKNKTNAYDRLSRFSKGLFDLAALLDQPVENGGFARAMPKIHYQISVIRYLEFPLRETVFKGKMPEMLFDKVDTALYLAECAARQAECPERSRNLETSRELVRAAVAAGRMAMEGSNQLANCGSTNRQIYRKIDTKPPKNGKS
jgi:hypothetical protein